MEVKFYRKKPVIIQAVHLTDDNAEQVAEWCRGRLDSAYGGFCAAVTIKTEEGSMLAMSGDWIIKGIKGEFYPCKPDIFEATYSEFGVASEAVLDGPSGGK